MYICSILSARITSYPFSKLQLFCCGLLCFVLCILYLSKQTEPEQKDINEWNENLQSIQDATAAQIVYIIRCHILKETQNEVLQYYNVQIQEYFSKINGQKLFELKRKEICHELEKLCEGNQKIKGSSMKLLKLLKEFDINKIPKTIPEHFNAKPPEYQLKVK